jgi:hypothetical protein
MKTLKFIIDYLIILPGNVLFSLGASQWYLFNQGPYLLREVLFFFVIQLVFTYETGYKKSFLTGEKKFFYFVYILPFFITLVSLLAGLFVLKF